MGEYAAAQLAELLDEEQEKRLRGISIQIAGVSAVLVDRNLAEELKITEDQKARLQEIQRGNMQEMSDTFRVPGIPPGESRGRFEELHAKGEKRLLAVLTTDQQKQLDARKGEAIKIDLMKLQGGGSGNRNRGR
jgi:hypothetical protein